MPGQFTAEFGRNESKTLLHQKQTSDEIFHSIIEDAKSEKSRDTYKGSSVLDRFPLSQEKGVQMDGFEADESDHVQSLSSKRKIKLP